MAFGALESIFRLEAVEQDTTDISLSSALVNIDSSWIVPFFDYEHFTERAQVFHFVSTPHSTW